MTIQNIIKKLIKNGITNYEIIPMQAGCDAVRVSYTIGYELINITDLFKRGVKIEIDSFAKSITLWNIKEWERSKRLYDNMTVLVELFYAELRTGKTPTEAKQTQRAYAEKNSMIDAFYMIYK